MNDSPANIDSLFGAAIAIASAEERAAYLDKCCADDPIKRRRLEKLLDAHFRAGDFLDVPAVLRIDCTCGKALKVAVKLIGKKIKCPSCAAVLVVKPPAAADADDAPSGTQAYNPPPAPPDVEAPGARIGPYKLLQQVGEGGMGTVWMAEQTAPVKRKVALKLIKAGMDSGQVLARFEAERQALAMMDHPNIAKVLDAGTTAGGRPFFVMELVKGIPITKYCDEQKLSPKERLELFIQVCHGIQHAHQKGIIHRDIKPSNVLVARYDDKAVPKVIDFGVAKATAEKLTERTMFTVLGGVVGTLEYMSPEQAQLNQLDIDTRSDVFALGILLYELLTGTPPLSRKRLKEAALMEALRLIREEEPPKPSSRLSSSDALPSISAQRQMEPTRLTKLIRGEVDWIVMKALEKDRTQRYETANAFARDIERYLRDEPVEAGPPSAGYRLRKMLRKYRTPLRVAGAFLVLLVVGAVVSAWQAVRATNAEATATAERDQAVLARQKSEEYAKRLKEEKLHSERLRYVSDMRLAHYAGEEYDFERLSTLLASYRQRLPGDIDRRGFEWYFLDGLSNDFAHLTLKGHLSQVGGVAFSPDGRLLASAAFDFTMGIWDVATGKKLHSTIAIKNLTGKDWLNYQGVAFSRDGRWLASAGPANHVKIWDPATGKELLKLDGHTGTVDCVAFSTDSRWLASVATDKTIKIWDVATRAEAISIIAPTTYRSSQCVAFSPDDKLLASADNDKTVKLWNPATGKLLRTLTGHNGPVTSIAFSPNGEWLAAASGDKTVKIWDLVTGKLLHNLKGHSGNVTSVAFSPNGGWLASGSEDKSVKIWEPFTGAEVLSLKGHLNGVSTVAFSPDNRHLASAGRDRTVKIWAVAAVQKSRQLTLKSQAAVWALAVGPDCRQLASAGADNTVKLWDMDTGKQMRTLAHNVRQSAVDKVGLALSCDGRLAAGRGDGPVKIWDSASGNELCTLVGHSNSVFCVTFSPDGQRLASGSMDRTVKVWDLTTGQALHTLEARNARAILGIAFSPDGRRLASVGHHNVVTIWDPATGRELFELEGHSMGGVMCVAFSPDGQLLATGSADNTIKLWNLATRQEVLTLSGHFDAVWGVAFSPDGRRLASSSGDKTVRLWDTSTGEEVLTLKGHSHAVHCVAFSPDGWRLVSAGGDKTIIIWDATPRAEAAADAKTVSGKANDAKK